MQVKGRARITYGGSGCDTKSASRSAANSKPGQMLSSNLLPPSLPPPSEGDPEREGKKSQVKPKAHPPDIDVVIAELAAVVDVLGSANRGQAR